MTGEEEEEEGEKGRDWSVIGVRKKIEGPERVGRSEAIESEFRQLTVKNRTLEEGEELEE